MNRAHTGEPPGKLGVAYARPAGERRQWVTYPSLSSAPPTATSFPRYSLNSITLSFAIPISVSVTVSFAITLAITLAITIAISISECQSDAYADS